MSNIFRMHMYRASKAVSTYVILIILAASLFMTLGLLVIAYDNPLTAMVTVTMTESGLEINRLTPTIVHMFYIQSSNTYLILVTVFAVIFTNCDFTRGFAKNTYSMFESRRTLVFSKWLALVTCISASYIVYSFAGLGLSAVCVKAFESARWGDYWVGFFVTYLCLISLVTMVFWITSLFKSPAGGMVIGILISSGTFALIEILIAGLFARTTHLDINLADYFLDYAFMSYNGSIGTAATIRTICVALVYLGLALTMSVFLSDRKDVNV